MQIPSISLFYTSIRAVDHALSRPQVVSIISYLIYKIIRTKLAILC